MFLSLFTQRCRRWFDLRLLIFFVFTINFSNDIGFLIHKSVMQNVGSGARVDLKDNHLKLHFPLFSRLIGKIDCIPLCPYMKYFPGLTSFILASCWARGICGKPIFEMGDRNLKKNWSVLSSKTTSRLDTLVLNFQENLQQLEI